MDDKLIKRTDMDFVRRSLPGVVVYMSVWPILALSLDYFDSHPVFSITFTLLLAILGGLRLLHAYSTKFIYHKYPTAWRFTMFALSLLHGGSLSSLVVISLSYAEYADMVLPTTLVQSAIISGAVSSLTPSPRFTQIYLTMLVAPVILMAALNPQFFYIAPLFTILWVYYFFLCRRFYTEYYRAFQIERSLKENQKKLEALSITDALTGIYNRQYFDKTLDTQWELASRSNSELSILFLDIDYFKKVNDDFGHLIGDKALCHSAQIFQDIAKRKSDMVARYGGEEFAIILPSTPHADALALAETIRAQLESHPLIYDKKTINLTVSIGINTIRPNLQLNSKDFLDNADKALYQAKATGRNKVMSYVNPSE